MKLLHFKILQCKYRAPSGSLIGERLRQLPSSNSNWGPPTYRNSHLPSCIVPCCPHCILLCRLSLLIFLSHLNTFDSCLSLSSANKRTLLFKYRVKRTDSHLPFVCSLKDKRYINPLTPNGHYMARTAQLTSRCCILYIYSKNIRT